MPIQTWLLINYLEELNNNFFCPSVIFHFAFKSDSHLQGTYYIGRLGFQENWPNLPKSKICRYQRKSSKKLHFTFMNYSRTFISKVLNITFNPFKLLNCDKFNHFDFFFSFKMSQSHILFKKKIKKPNKKKKKRKEICQGGLNTPTYFSSFFFFLDLFKN